MTEIGEKQISQLTVILEYVLHMTQNFTNKD